jgi:hypothetical protein
MFIAFGQRGFKYFWNPEGFFDLEQMDAQGMNNRIMISNYDYVIMKWYAVNTHYVSLVNDPSHIGKDKYS